MKLNIIALTVALLLAACGGTPKPTVDDLGNTIRVNDLHDLFTFVEITAEDFTNTGTEDRPVWATRYEITVSAREDTYDLDAVVSGKDLLKPVQTAGATYTLYGRSSSTYTDGGGWTHQTRTDWSRIGAVGKPRSFFSDEAILVSSDEAQALLAERSAREEERQQEAEAARMRAAAIERENREWLEAQAQEYGAQYLPERISSLGTRVLNFGEPIDFLVTGEETITREVVGTEIYHSGSDAIGSVIHSGVLEKGQPGVVRAVPVESRDYHGSPRNGIESESARTTRHGTNRIGYTLELVVAKER